MNNEVTVWADFGAGSGLFTHALGQLLIPGSSIQAVDKNHSRFDIKNSRPGIGIEFLRADFDNDHFKTHKLDGILMANSLHYVQNKEDFLKRCERHFKQNPTFLIVEYDLSVPNPWVPFPVDFRSLCQLFRTGGFSVVEKIHEAPSRLNRSNIYSLIARKERW